MVNQHRDPRGNTGTGQSAGTTVGEAKEQVQQKAADVKEQVQQVATQTLKDEAESQGLTQ